VAGATKANSHEIKANISSDKFFIDWLQNREFLETPEIFSILQPINSLKNFPCDM